MSETKNIARGLELLKLKNRYGTPCSLQTSSEASELMLLLSAALKAICLIRDYVGPDVLPAIDGWEWYDAAKKIAVAIPDDEWVTQFASRLNECPVCKSDTGLKLPRDDTAYCEDCGWPHEDFAEL